MASFRAATKGLRRTHKERGQPENREHLGLLEKKKDYKLRSADYKRKQDVLRKLKLKAALRNPDEFSFGMVNSKTKNGVHILERKRKRQNAKQLKQMRTEDLSYLVSKRQSEVHKVESLQSTLHCLDAPPMNKHTVFVDSENDLQDFDPENYFNTPAELVTRTYNRPTNDQLRSGLIASVPATSTSSSSSSSSASSSSLIAPTKGFGKVKKERAKKYEELEKRMVRAEGLEELIEKAKLQKELMGKGPRVKKVKVDKMTGEKKVTYRWKKVRSK